MISRFPEEREVWVIFPDFRRPAGLSVPANCRKIEDLADGNEGDVWLAVQRTQSSFSKPVPADRSNPDIRFCRNNRKVA